MADALAPPTTKPSATTSATNNPRANIIDATLSSCKQLNRTGFDGELGHTEPVRLTVTAGDRGDLTELLPRSTRVRVPSATRTISMTMHATG